MRFFLLLQLLFSLILINALDTNAQIILREDFDYPIGDTIASVNPSKGWIISSGGNTNYFTSVSPGLTYPGYSGSGIGNATSLTTTGQDIYKDASTSITSGNAYVTFMLNVSAAQAPGDYVFGMLPNTSALTPFARFFIKLSSTGFYKVGISKFSVGAIEAATYSNESFAFNSTFLVVIKYQFNTGTNDDSVKVFMLTSGIPDTEPANATVQNLGAIGAGNADATTIGRIILRQGSSTNSPTLKVDGITVLNNWWDIKKVNTTNSTPGKLYQWGKILNATNSILPISQIGNEKDWTDISTSGNHSLGLRNGTLWAWGRNDNGQLGDNTFIDRLTPQQIGTDTNWFQVATGYVHSAALKNDGSLWTWGNNVFGKLGDGTNLSQKIPVPIAEGQKFSKVIVGQFSTFAIDLIDSTLWGSGRLFVGGKFSSILTKIDSSKWKTICFNHDGTLFIGIKSDNTLWGCGLNSNGILGNQSSYTELTRIGSDNDWLDITYGYQELLGLKSNRKLFGWVGEPKLPILIDSVKTWSKVISDGVTSIGLMTDSSLWHWGSNYYGQNGTQNISSMIIKPTRIGDSNKWLMVGSNKTVYAILADDKSNPIHSFYSTPTYTRSSNVSWKLPDYYDNGQNEVIIFAKNNGTLTTFKPTNDISFFTPNNYFANGTKNNSDTSAFCVYVGDSANFVLKNLNFQQNYFLYGYVHDKIRNKYSDAVISTFVQNIPPPEPINNIEFTYLSQNNSNLFWNKSSSYDNNKYTTVVFIKANSSIKDGSPNLPVINYSSGSIWNNGSKLEFDDSAYCIYSGDTNSIITRNLTDGVTYYINAWVLEDHDNTKSDVSKKIVNNFIKPTKYSIGQINKISKQTTLPDSFDLRVEISGVVCGFNQIKKGVRFLLTDTTGGITIYDTTYITNFIKEGDSLKIKGRVLSEKGLPVIGLVDEIVTLPKSNNSFFSKVVTTLDLSSINQLVEIKNIELIAQIPSGKWPTESMTYKLLNQSKDTISVFLPELSYLKGVPIPTSKLLNIRGVCEMRSKDTQAPFLTNEYYIIPRYASDIKPVVNNSILEQNNNTEFNIFPNPADNILTIKSNKDKINKLTLFDSHGIELIQEFPSSDTRTIDISYIPAGFYILEIVTNNESRKIKISIF